MNNVIAGRHAAKDENSVIVTLFSKRKLMRTDEKMEKMKAMCG